MPGITCAPFSKTTFAKPPVKTKSRRIDMVGKKDDEDGGSESGASGPADSIMDSSSSSEEEADNEVDGMLGE